MNSTELMLTGTGSYCSILVTTCEEGPLGSPAAHGLCTLAVQVSTTTPEQEDKNKDNHKG